MKTLIKHTTNFLLFASLFSISIVSNAQEPEQDCINAIPVCQEIYVQPNSYSGEGEIPNEIPSGGGGCDGTGNCMQSGEKNDVWYIFTIQSGGMLGFEIDPVNPTDDYDWVVYNLTNADCEDIFSQAVSLQVSCNWSGTSGLTGANGQNNQDCGDAGDPPFNSLIPVVEGQTYVLNVSNYSSSQDGYTLDFSISTADIYDDVDPEIVHVYGEDVTCGDHKLDFSFTENVACESVTPASFELTGPGGPYDIVNVSGEACQQGGQWENRYTATISQTFSMSGAYTFKLLAFSGIVDACNNTADPSQTVFYVDLDVPEVSEDDLDVSNSTCGQMNGSITGIVVEGNEPLEYEWTDGSGDPVGDELDLTGVGPGEYSLTITDVNTCEVMAGPYTVEDEGAPDVIVADTIITDNTCGNVNGSITGIQVNGHDPFTYRWVDQDDQQVGDQLNITGLEGGTYTLYIEDVNGCEAVTGPYTILDLPAPVLMDDNVNTQGENCDMSNAFIEGIQVQSQQSPVFRWYNQDGELVGTELDLLSIPAGEYTLMVEDTNGCTATVGPHELPYYAAPSIDESQASMTNAQCGFDIGSISGIEVGADLPFSMEWTDEDGNVVGDTTYLEELAPGEYTLHVWDTAGCTDQSQTYTIVNNGDPITVQADGTTPLCSGETLQLFVDYDDEAEYLWTGPDNFSSTEQNPVIDSVQLEHAGTYHVTVTSLPWECQDESSTQIEVTQSYTVSLDITVSDTLIFPGSEITFTAHAENPGNSPDYEWIINGEVVQSGSQNTFTTSDIKTDRTVVCRLFVEEECNEPKPAVSNSIDVFVKPVKLYMPNAFRPGSVHGNEAFKAISISEKVAEYEMRIFDRWGKVIFTSNDVSEGWDGTVNGDPAPAGVYVWMVSYAIFGTDNQPIRESQRGTVTLVR
ncbi:MAG: gliding motility-associated C-terminal domain-containing protein [Bacteroidales bacterium]|nr:gliding motility-associated C-terminal domain-containing protein [Bacteroidales bacterium]MCF8352468.1 gliding motility-associated C-terminal domain-containing protein [Bacteroidales bacterium]MCF8375394.1 gliding motility-associated C-terminal domain-containing protein [Bacteroidales bacterium]MCF8401267.1 gliding motility-associated C-terminal domain-containing protein [Bacteroidales bacterium]